VSPRTTLASPFLAEHEKYTRKARGEGGHGKEEKVCLGKRRKGGSATLPNLHPSLAPALAARAAQQGWVEERLDCRLWIAFGGGAS
jgi:hypothetical protein